MNKPRHRGYLPLAGRRRRWSARPRLSSSIRRGARPAIRPTSRASPSPARASSRPSPTSWRSTWRSSASSELTADAIVKYRDAKQRIRDAFAALKLDNVSVEERGLLVDQKGQMQSPYFFDYQPNTRTKTEVQLTRKLVVKASDIRKMDEEGVLQLVGRLLDVAQDAGGKVGPQNNMNPYYYYRWG